MRIAALVLAAFVLGVFLLSWPQDMKRKPSIRATLAQIALINSANKYKIDPYLLLSISYIETAKTFRTDIRPQRKNGTYIGTARWLCQFIKVMAKAYDLDWKSNDAKAQAKACAKITADNKRYLLKKLNRTPKGSEIYLAHVFGVGRAVRIIKAAGATPLSEVLSGKAVRNNNFLKRYKNAAGLRKWAARKIKSARIDIDHYIAAF